MKKKLVKIIALLVLSLVGIFCCSNAFACSDDRGHNIVSYDYNSTTGFIELGITFDGYVNDMSMSSEWMEYFGFMSSEYNRYQGLYLHNTGKYLGGPKYVSGCGYYALYGIEWASATTGNTCTMCFSEIWSFNSGDPVLLVSSAGTCLTKAEIDGHFGTDFLENRRADGLSLIDSDANFSIWGTADTTTFDWATCDVKVGSIVPPVDPDPVDATCGSSDRQTYSYPTTLPEDFCATGELVTPSLVYDGYGWNWSCSGLYGGESVSCEAYNSLSDPTIDDVIDFNWDDFDYDFEEGDVSKNWLIEVFKFLFLPREQTLQKFFTTFDNLKQKIPFGYIYLIRDKFKEVSLESTDEFALNLELLGEDYEVFSVTSLKQKIGENTFNIFYNTMKALIWIVFALYLIVKVQKLFNNND
jgi:hypothetical protein